MSRLLKAVKEASISVACLLDDVAVSEDDILNCELDLNELQKDIEHLQDQITIIENELDPFVVEELDSIKNKEDYVNEDKYQSIKSDNADYFVQEEA